MVTGTNKREFTDSAFNPADTASYHLSIETGDSFLYCAVHDIKTGKLLAIDAEKPEYMNKEFRTVMCSVINTHFTLIPDDIFDKDSSLQYLSLNSPVNENFSIHQQLIPGLNAWCVYAVEKEFEEKIEKKYPSVLIRHSVNTSLQNILVRVSSTGNEAWIVVFKGIFILAFFDGTRLKFCNVFEYKVHEDLAYYLHFASEQLHIPISGLKVTLTGPAINPSMEVFLKKFLDLHLPDDKFPADDYHNRFFTLIHQQSCV